MAQIPYRANLQTTSFPLLSELSGRTVIVGNQDQNYVRGVSGGENGVPTDIGIPQIYYAHNVMPSTYGYQSVGYKEEYNNIDFGAWVPGPVDFQQIHLVQGGQVIGGRPAPTSGKTYIGIGRPGNQGVFFLRASTGTWVPALGSPTVTASTKITIATVNGVSYIFFSNIGAYILNDFTDVMTLRPLAGLDVASMVGLAATNGYLFAFSRTSAAWSSVVDVEDFVPSEESGAGGGAIQEAKGAIVAASNTALGLILHTEANAVSVIYSGNADFPFNFKEVPSAGGIAGADQVSSDQISGFYQMYSTNGLQQIGHTGAKTISPQITDFVAGDVFEDYDIVTGTFSESQFDWSMRKAISVVADRYVVVSYGLYPGASMTHAIVLDVTQGRMGKLKVVHNECFELRSLAPGVVETPRGSMAFLQSSGRIVSVDFSLDATAPDAIMLLGKYQMVRQRMTELHEVELENVNLGVDFELHALPTLDGKNYVAPQAGYLLESNPDFRRYTFQSMVGTNISLLAKGRFNLISLLLWLTPQGRR